MLELLRYLVLHPRLKIECDNPETGNGWSNHSIVVTNRGFSVARTCQGMLTLPDLAKEDLLSDTEIQRVEALGLDSRKFNVDEPQSFLLQRGDFRKIENELTVWSLLGSPFKIDLYRNTSPMLNICLVMKKPGKVPQLHFPSERGWQYVRAVTPIPTKPFRVKVRIAAVNAPLAEREFLIKPCGDDIRLEPTNGRFRRFWDRLSRQPDNPACVGVSESG